MIVYSEKIVRFLEDVKRCIRDVLVKELGLKVHGDRFYNREETASYPIRVVIYNNRAMLGYFDPEFYEMGFHEQLMRVKEEERAHVVRHEIAHYMTFMKYGVDVCSHGLEFREFCLSAGWGPEVFKATGCLEGALQEVSPDCPILRKVEKLMALAASSNSHEAEAAMIKSQQLLLKHNIDASYLGQDKERVVLKRIMRQTKEDAKMSAIAKIIETFFVSVVFSRGDRYSYLEILGSAVNVDIAEYVALVLNNELENLWLQAKDVVGLSGLVAKNSFFLGIAKGYCDKIQALKRDYTSEDSCAVMVIEKSLEEARKMAYKKLSSKTSRRSRCMQSSALGEKVGRELTIRPAINQNQLLIGKR